MTSASPAKPAFYVPSPPPPGVVLAVPAAIADICQEAQTAIAAALEEVGLSVERETGGVYVTVQMPSPNWRAVAFFRLGRPGYTSELRFCLTSPICKITLTEKPGRYEKFAGAIAGCLAGWRSLAR
ncbi:hypothetical protein AB0F17_34175 [Nonomuraea sp. NPDC026600]|uniref:hypothetical protein n=1 Tax=Nonomuraea sp. NPDC026600 TaxID=3155363 RepID=UPI0033F3F141